MFSRLLKTVALVLVGACLVTSTARADLTLYAQEDGVNGSAITQIATTATDFSAVQFTGDYGDFTLVFDGATTHNTATLSSLLGGSISLKNNADDFRTINLFASQTNYSLPTGTPLNVESGLSGTVNTGTLTGTGVFQAFLDTNNQQLGNSFTNGPQDVVFTGSTFDTGSAFGSFDRTNPLYSITSQVTATVSGGGEGNFSDHINVTAVPEPSTLASACIGLAMLGTYLRRRRRAKACA